MKKSIYCISGLGADERVFDHFSIEGFELIHIRWKVPGKSESLVAYAKRMSADIQEDEPLVIGVSFGGMLGIEIAKQRKIRKLFLISSVKSKNEMPAWMKLAARFQLHKMLPVKSNKLTERFDNSRLGVSNEHEKKMVRDYRKNADPVYTNWAIDQVLNWNNEWCPENLVHIHGDKDRIFPIKRINASHIIRGGTHFMIYNRAEEISSVIRKEILK